MPDNDEIIVTGPWVHPGGSGGGGGGSGGGGSSSTPPDSGPPPGPADLWRMSGRMDCNNLKEGFNSVVYAVSNTRTGKRLIESSYNNPRFRVNLVMYDPDDPDTYSGYNTANDTLTFDPYVNGFGTNPDGSEWRQSGIVIFAHELAHQMLGPGREADVIRLTNQFVTELRSTPFGDPSSPHGDRSTNNRVGHSGQFQTGSSVMDTEFGLHPPCNNE